MNEAKLVNSLYGKDAFSDVESCHVFGKRIVFDEHRH